MHEKIAKENDDMNDKLDQFCEMFSLRPQKCERASSRTEAEKTITIAGGEGRKTVVKNDTSHALLPNDKKNALLMALEMIDLEKTGPNSADSVAVEKRNDKIFKPKEKASKRNWTKLFSFLVFQALRLIFSNCDTNRVKIKFRTKTFCIDRE